MQLKLPFGWAIHFPAGRIHNIAGQLSYSIKKKNTLKGDPMNMFPLKTDVYVRQTVSFQSEVRRLVSGSF